MNILITGHYKHIFHDGNCFKQKKGTFLDNNFYKFIKLRDAFNSRGINLIASDTLVNMKNIDGLIVNDHPRDEGLIKSINEYIGPKFLIAEEAPFIYPDNYDLKRSSEYDLIFTYLKEGVKNNKYLYAFPFFLDKPEALKIRTRDIHPELKKKKVFVGTQKKPQEKKVNHSNYSMRDDLIHWYVENMPNDFDLYGNKWDRLYWQGDDIFSKIFNYHKLDKFSLFKTDEYSDVYRGRLDSKYGALNKYKYQFCFENSIGYEGFITEKVIDALICRNVPVYYPSTASSLSGVIPEDVYVNMYNFKTFKELNSYLDGLSQNEYCDFIQRIDNFIDNLPKILSEDYWANLLADNVINMIQSRRL